MRTEHHTRSRVPAGFVLGIGADGFVSTCMGDDAPGVTHGQPLATDSSSAAILRQIMAGGMYDALRRIRNESEASGSTGNLGGGTVGTPMEGGGTMRAGRGPNIRYGRQHVPGGSNGLGRFDGNAPGANGYGLTNAPYTAPLDAKGEGGHLSPRELFSYLKAHGATDNEATMLTGAAGSESSFNPNAIHDVNGKNGPGHGLWGHNDLHRIDMRGKTWQQQADLALDEVKRDYADRVNAAKTPEELADAEMHYERPRGYHGNNPRGGDNYMGRLNTIRRFSHGFGTMGFDKAAPEAAEATPGSANPVASDSSDVAAARRYLEQTATGAAVARRDSISKLNPAFVVKAAEAIRQARAEGIHAGIFSGYRKPTQTGSVYDANGFSSHSYGIGSDFSGIGTAGSATSRRFDQITRGVGLGGYGPDNMREFNHKELGVHLQHDRARLEAMKRTLGPGGLMVNPEATWAASGYVVPKGMARNLPNVTPDAPAPLADRTFGGYLRKGGAFAVKPRGDGLDLSPEGQRAAEKAVLPQKPVSAPTPPQTAPANVDLKVGGLDALREAHHYLDSIHRKAASLSNVNIRSRVHHEDHIAAGAPRPGTLRTSLNGHYGSDGRSWT